MNEEGLTHEKSWFDGSKDMDDIEAKKTENLDDSIPVKEMECDNGIEGNGIENNGNMDDMVKEMSCDEASDFEDNANKMECDEVSDSEVVSKMEDFKDELSPNLIKKSVEDEITRESVEDEISRESVEDEISRECVEDEISRESVEDEISRVCVEDEISRESVEDEIIKECDEDKIIKGPKEKESQSNEHLDQIEEEEEEAKEDITFDHDPKESGEESDPEDEKVEDSKHKIEDVHSEEHDEDSEHEENESDEGSEDNEEAVVNEEEEQNHHDDSHSEHEEEEFVGSKLLQKPSNSEENHEFSGFENKDLSSHDHEDGNLSDVASECSETTKDRTKDLHDESCDIPEEDAEEYKSRFNLRKRNQNSSSLEEYGSDYDNDVDISKRLKLSFSKKNYRRQRPYTNEAVKLAVRMIQNKKMSLQEASREFNIPRTSLHNFVQLYKRGRKSGFRTLSTGLTKQEETEIVALIMKLSRCGKRYSHNELRFLVQYYLVSNDRPVFKSGTLPTMGWIAGLVERQKELLKAKSKKNTKVALEDVQEWQDQIEDYLVNDWDMDISDMFSYENAYRIFCFNAFRLLINSPGENAENKPSPVKKEPGVDDDKSDVEVGTILGMSADGRFMDPLIIIPEDKKDICNEPSRDDMRIFFNKSAKVDEEVAMKVVRNFDEDITKRGIPKPVVFFVNDKHDLAHFSVIEYCWENQIIIICLPPKTTKTMTPFEIGIWPKIRTSYSNLWKNAPKNFDNKISVNQYVELFGSAWDSVKNPKQAMRSFIKSGLIPLNVPSILKEAGSEQQNEQQLNLQRQMERYNRQRQKNLTSKKVEKPEQNNKSSPSLFSSNVQESSELSELSSMEERSRGKLEGIEMCLRAIESFIPPDVFPIWNQRGADYRGRCELAFKLWRSVSLLLKAGCAMASIQQMADGFFNPFGADFSSTASFFQKPLAPATPAPSNSSSRSVSPTFSSSAPLIRAEKKTTERPVQKKRKLKINKSIYSRSKDLSYELNQMSNNENKKPDIQQPFVKLYQNPFLLAQDGSEL